MIKKVYNIKYNNTNKLLKNSNAITSSNINLQCLK